MEDRQFDRLARMLGDRASRRDAVRRLGVAGFVAGLFGAGFARPSAVDAHHCGGEGCACRYDAAHPCNDPLICCGEANYPNGLGVCQTQYQCTGYGAPGDDCPRYCAAGQPCPSCVSGYCTFQFVCG
jgi:hypothetical protein